MAVSIGAGLASFSSGLIFSAGGYLALSLIGFGFALVLLAAVAWFLLPHQPAQSMAAGQD